MQGLNRHKVAAVSKLLRNILIDIYNTRNTVINRIGMERTSTLHIKSNKNKAHSLVKMQLSNPVYN